MPEVQVDGPERERDDGVGEHAQLARDGRGEQRLQQGAGQAEHQQQRAQIGHQDVLGHVGEDQLAADVGDGRDERQQDHCDPEAEAGHAPGRHGAPWRASVRARIQ